MSTQEKIDAQVREYLAGAERWFRFRLEACESPIEQLLLAALFNDKWRTPDKRDAYEAGVAVCRSWGIVPSKWLYVCEFEACYLCLQPEVPIGHKYRLDFALVSRLDRIAIELDGHNFHEKTKDQVRRDKARDRAFTLAGWKVLRFTGSEVFGNVGAIVETIRDLAEVTACRVWEADHPDREKDGIPAHLKTAAPTKAGGAP